MSDKYAVQVSHSSKHKKKKLYGCVATLKSFLRNVSNFLISGPLGSEAVVCRRFGRPTRFAFYTFHIRHLFARCYNNSNNNDIIAFSAARSPRLVGTLKTLSRRSVTVRTSVLDKTIESCPRTIHRSNDAISRFLFENITYRARILVRACDSNTISTLT